MCNECFNIISLLYGYAIRNILDQFQEKYTSSVSAFYLNIN